MTPDLKRELLIESVRLHAHALLRMPWINAFLMVGFALFMYRFVDPVLFFGWAALMIGVELLRARYCARLLARGNEFDPRREHSRLIALAALAGGAIGAGGVVFMPRLPIVQQALFGAVMFAIPAAGVAVSQSSRQILTAFSLCVLPPVAVTWSALYPDQAWALGSLTVLYCAVIVFVAADAEKLLLRSLLIRHERDRLVLDLEQRNADVQAAMAAAEQSAQARARVLAAASHDLRQPLQALSVYSAVLAANPAPLTLPEVSQNIDQIVRSLGNLLDGLLDLSRLSIGQYVAEKSDFSLDRLVAQLCAEYRESAARKGVQIIERLQPISLHDDAIAIGRIVRNLLDNAVKYTDRGEIIVRVEQRAAGADRPPRPLVSVLDTGKGIPPEEIERIFEEFYQLDNPGRDRSRGVGLGLAIVKRLVELLGASVTVDSQLGIGTRFELTLAGSPADRGSARGADLCNADTTLRGKTVYVVDDEVDIRKSMAALLSAWGGTVETAGAPAEVEALFKARGSPDLLIVDLRLGAGLLGAELAAGLVRSYGHFPVIVVTGETSADAARAATVHGFTLLRKPIAPEILLRAMSTAMAQPA